VATPLDTIAFPGLVLIIRLRLAVTPLNPTAFPGLCLFYLLSFYGHPARQDCFPRLCLFYPLLLCCDSARQGCFLPLLSFLSALVVRLPRWVQEFSPVFVLIIRLRLAVTPLDTGAFPAPCLFYPLWTE
jgi:hypothetical protein